MDPFWSLQHVCIYGLAGLLGGTRKGELSPEGRELTKKREGRGGGMMNPSL